jgi:hypothetical protein
MKVFEFFRLGKSAACRFQANTDLKGQKMKNVMLKFGTSFAGAVALVSSGLASAAVDPSISGAITTAQADAVTVAGLITTAILLLFAAKFLRKGI